MIERARRIGFARMRRTSGTLTAALAVGLVAIGLFAAVGQASQSPSIAFNPASVSFGSTAGGSSSKTLTLKNTGASASAVISIVLSGPPAFKITADGCTGTSLGPNTACSVTVSYSPTASGSNDTATLTATGKKSAAKASAMLTGKGFTSFMETACSGPSTCSVSTATNTGSVSVNTTGGTNSSSGTLQAGITTGTLGCVGLYNRTGDLHLDPNTFTVFSSSSDYGKTVTITYPAGSSAPPAASSSDNDSTNDGDGDFDDVKWVSQVCFQAPYRFTTRDNVQASGPDAQGLYTGLLPDCTGSNGPCVDRPSGMLTNVGADGTTTYDISLVVDIPPSEPGDPLMN